MSVLFTKWASIWKQEAFNDSVIKITHDFWAETGGSMETFGYFIGKITVANIDTNGASIDELQVLLDMDDNSINWDVVLLDVALNSVDNLTLDFGALKSGQSTTLTYRWCGKCLNGIPGDTAFGYQFNIMPSYRVTYNKADAWVSKGVLKPS